MPKLRESKETKINHNAKAVIISESIKLGWNKPNSDKQ